VTYWLWLVSKMLKIVRHCKASEMKNCHAVSTTGLFGTRPYLGALAGYLLDDVGPVSTPLCTWSFDVPNGAGQWRTQEFFRGGLGQEFFSRGEVQQIRLRIEDKENGDLKAVAPSQRFHSIYK
jgi:hypothetical protein